MLLFNFNRGEKMQKISLMKLFMATVVWAGIIEAASQDKYMITVQNLSDKKRFLYFNGSEDPSTQISPNSIQQVAAPILEKIEYDPLSFLINKKGLINLSASQQQALKKGAAYILLDKKDSEPVIKMGQPESEPEQKKSAQVPRYAPSASIETTLRAQLKKALDDLASAHARITQLENKVRELQQELQPGS